MPKPNASLLTEHISELIERRLVGGCMMHLLTELLDRPHLRPKDRLEIRRMVRHWRRIRARQ